MDTLAPQGVSNPANSKIDTDRRWQIALECAEHGVWEVNTALNSSCHSSIWFTMRGLNPSDLEQASFEKWMSRIHEDDRAVWLQNIRNNQNRTNDVVRCEYRERHTDGRWISILSQGRIISRDENGNPLQIIGTDLDNSELKLAQQRVQELSDSEQRWRVALESAGQGLWDINHRTKEKFFSEAWYTIRGKHNGEPERAEGQDWFDEIHPEDRERLRTEIEALSSTASDVVNHEYRNRTKSGDWVWIMSRGKIVDRDSDGNPMRVIGTDTDITALKSSESELKRLSHRYELAISTAKLGVWEFDLTELLPIWDDNTKELFGVTGRCEDLPPDIWEQRIHPDDRERAMATADAAVRNCGNYAMDYRIVLPSGEIRHVRCRAVYHVDTTKGPRLVGVNWDVTQDYKHAEELQRAKELAENNSREIEAARLALEHNALHDALTGLPNRRHLDNVLRLINEHKNQIVKSRVALMHVDLDRFKEINDTLGHLAGDAILCRVAQILQATVADIGIVCRSGGDEFQIVFPAAPSEKKLTRLASKLLRQLNEPIIYDGHECRYGASIGIAFQDPESTSTRNLLSNADIALYQAKSEGRNRFCVFTQDMHQKAIAKKNCADDIKRGLDRHEFFAVYQPQFDAHNHQIIGVEALARWRHPERGILTPDKFLQVAEEINVVALIDEMILEQALADMNVWREAGVNIPRVSVNISARRLGDSKLIEGLRKLEIPKGSISFELLESIYLDKHSDTIAHNIAEIRNMGIGIEIDDFGTGHASIACLLSLRPMRLKIDRQLITPLLVSVESQRLLASIVDIGKALGIEVLAEGVETKEHAKILARLDCDSLQGFAFARPMLASELVSFVADERWKTAA